jgi:hypothetical protein
MGNVSWSGTTFARDYPQHSPIGESDNGQVWRGYFGDPEVGRSWFVVFVTRDGHHEYRNNMTKGEAYQMCLSLNRTYDVA